MRKLSVREKTLLGAMTALAVFVWFVVGDASTDRIENTPTTRLAALGALPVVHLELLGGATSTLDPNGRDLFSYYEPPRQRVIERERIPTPPPPGPGSTETVRDRGRQQPSAPVPPRPGFTYIGHVGPQDDLIAVFDLGGGVTVAQVGEAVDDQFELLSFRYEAVVLGYRDGPFRGETVELARSSS